MTPKRHLYLRTTLFFAVVAAVAVATALAVALLVMRPPGHDSSHRATPYEALNLSAEEQERVDEVYERFEAERADLLAEFHELQRTLAVLLQEEEQYSPRLAETVGRLHEVHAELQEISIRRFFGVLEALPPTKQKELRKLAADTLSQPE